MFVWCWRFVIVVVLLLAVKLWFVVVIIIVLLLEVCFLCYLIIGYECVFD